MTTESKSLEPRVVAMETKIDAFGFAIDRLTKAVETIAARPQQIAWREIALTAGTVLAMFAYVGNYLEGQYSKNITPEKQRLERLERAVCLAKPEFCILLSSK